MIMNKVYSKIESINGSVITVKAQDVAYGEHPLCRSDIAGWPLYGEACARKGADCPGRKHPDIYKQPIARFWG